MEPLGYFLFFLLAAVFVFILVNSRFHARKKPPVKWGSIQNSIEQELLPPQFQNVSADVAPLVLAIYESVKRYKDLYLTNINRNYYFTARSKRYELRITLSPSNSQKYSLNLILEGEHPHQFNIDRERKFKKKTSHITEDGIAPFLEPLSFFEKVVARPGILSADRTLDLDTSMQNWPQVLSAFIRLGRFLMDSEVRQKILEAADVLCPYCRGEFNAKDDTVSCRECKTRHHQECWEEVGRCSVFGCGHKSEIVIS